MQRTLAHDVSFEGVGLHTGEKGVVTFRPAPANAGVSFVRLDLPNHPRIQVRPENALFDPKAGRRTILQQDGVQVHTMEHALAAVAGLGIDNVEIEISSLEFPEPADGSAEPIARLLKGAGFVEQDRPRRHIKVTKPVHWSENGVELSAVPYHGFKITFTIDYPNPVVGHQTLSLDIDDETFLREVAPARTFVLERDIETLRQAGWIKGGRLENAVVVGEKGILNQEPLRFPDEFVRHKILDLLGDLFLLGGPLLGHVTARRSGHHGHVAFVHHLKRTLPLPGRRPGSPPEEWDITAIMDIMPHRYPFLLVDRITRIEEGHSIEGIKNVTINEPFFQGHFPGHPIMPAVLIIEAMAQVGGHLLLNSVDDPAGKLMYFMGIDGARFRRPVTPGDQLHFKLTLLKLKGPISKMKGEAYVDGQLVAEAELLATVVDKTPREAEMSTTIHPASFVDDRAELGADVMIEPGAIVGPHARIGDRTRVGSHALVTGWTRVGHDCHLHHGAVVGSPPQDLKYTGERSYLEVGDHTVLREYCTLNLASEPEATTRVGSHCLLMAYSHVAHNCQIGNRVVVANAVQFAGYVTVEDWAIVGGGTLVHQFVRIGAHAMVGGGSRVTQDVAPYVKAAGSPPRLAGLNAIGLERRGIAEETRKALDLAYRLLFRQQLTVPDAVARIRATLPSLPEVEHLARFAETSDRGLTR